MLQDELTLKIRVGKRNQAQKITTVILFTGDTAHEPMLPSRLALSQLEEDGHEPCLLTNVEDYLRVERNDLELNSSDSCKNLKIY